MCKEEKELENLIHSCIRAIAHCSSAAAHAAKMKRADDQHEFNLWKAEYDSSGVRLETLRESLESTDGYMDAQKVQPGPIQVRAWLANDTGSQ